MSVKSLLLGIRRGLPLLSASGSQTIFCWISDSVSDSISDLVSDSNPYKVSDDLQTEICKLQSAVREGEFQVISLGHLKGVDIHQQWSFLS